MTSQHSKRNSSEREVSDEDAKSNFFGNPFWHMAIMAEHLEFHNKELSLEEHMERTVPQELCRKVWNSCIGEELSDEQKLYVVANSSIPKSDFDPLPDDDIQNIADILGEHFPDGRPFSLSDVVFDELEMKKGIDCSGFVFLNLSMCNSSVSDAGFDGAVFLGSCQMRETKFRGETGFEAAHFKRGVNFHKSTFDHALFIGTRFGLAQFVDVEFNDSVIFSNAKFTDEARFHNSIFRDLTIFSGVKFQSEPPQFFEAKIHEDTDFSRISWPKPHVEPTRDLRAYECLKRLVGEQKKYRLEHFYLKKEMECQEQTDGPFYSIPSRTFKFFSDYGWSYSRPAISLLAAWLFGALGFIILTCQPLQWSHQFLKTCLPTMLALSFSNLFGFLGIGRTLMGEELAALDGNRFAELLAGAQMIAGPLFLFLLILGFRNRFRMK